MNIHREGYVSLIVTFLVMVALIVAVRLLFPDAHYLHVATYAFAVFGFLVILQFFRNPVRNTVLNEEHVIAPADGKVVVIEEVEEKEFFKDKRKQVSIFMSPINVHVNRYPVSGKVEYFKYHPGKYLVAWHPKSSEENERTSIVIKKGEDFALMLKQIAGAMAKRIVHYCETGDEVKQGAELGFIKFGSRVDLLLPLNAKIKVNLNDKVKGGETVIAEIPLKVE